MSGGSLDYFYCTLRDHIGDFGDKELDDLVKDLALLFHDREWFLSGDVGMGDWNAARDAFKAKWFTQTGREDRIEKYLMDIADEVRRSLGFSRKYCQYCAFWSRCDKKGYETYGHCEHITGCLKDEMDFCDRFAEGDMKDG